MLCGGTEMAYKHSRIVSNEVTSVDFHKLKASEVNTFSNRRQQGFKTFAINEWNQEQETIRRRRCGTFFVEITITAEYLPSIG